MDPTLVGDVLARFGRSVNAGQRAVIDATVASGHGVQVIEALAGTGKTYTAGILRLSMSALAAGSSVSRPPDGRCASWPNRRASRRARWTRS